ncbi:MAG TPA: 3-deoxy-8-phosphooctulonate synthase, partial [Citreicella sp.]|nr:3-deoxy-8-phosphooctulonate synthase [Citreicella sp.]
MKTVTVKDVAISNAAPLALICGPCQLETLEHARML